MKALSSTFRTLNVVWVVVLILPLIYTAAPAGAAVPTAAPAAAGADAGVSPVVSAQGVLTGTVAPPPMDPTVPISGMVEYASLGISVDAEPFYGKKPETTTARAQLA